MIRWDENCGIISEANYENGKIHGLKKLYHDNGKLKEESNWENDDLITGSVRNFDEDGKLIQNQYKGLRDEFFQ